MIYDSGFFFILYTYYNAFAFFSHLFFVRPTVSRTLTTGFGGQKFTFSQMCGTAVIYERQPFFIYNTNSRPRRESKLCFQYSILCVSTRHVMHSVDYYVKQSVLLKHTGRISRIYVIYHNNLRRAQCKCVLLQIALVTDDIRFSA